MSRSQFPLTPAMSGGFIIQDHQNNEVESSFALPPAAMTPVQTAVKGRTLSSSRRDSETPFCPVSPASPEFTAIGRSKSNTSLQAGTKRGLDEFNLPPPPTRTRKIIQVKPKPQSTTTKAASTVTSTATSKSKESSTTSGAKAANTTATSTSKKKQQPSATSAAGRKIARKTAHSLIERRRRSKMNEEFSTLKNMIPACRGQEMHKLAILQASIDYVNYLEQCITDLKAASGLNPKAETSGPSNPPSPSPPVIAAGVEGSRIGSSDGGGSSSVSPALLPSSGAQSAVFSPSFSPAFSPHNALSQHPPRIIGGADFSNPTTSSSSSHILPSPALGPSKSPLVTWRTPVQPISASQSPAILPQQQQQRQQQQQQRDPHHRDPLAHQRQSSSSYSAGGDADIDHEASAALLMLNMGRRATLDSVSRPLLPTLETTTTSNPNPPSAIAPQARRSKGIKTEKIEDNSSSATATAATEVGPNKKKKMGMSVSDLLVS